MSPRHSRRNIRRYKPTVYQKTITNLKNRIKNYRKNYVENGNPTHGQKKGNAGHVKTGQTKFLIPHGNFLSLQLHGVPNNCVCDK